MRRTLDSPTRRTLESPTRNERLAAGSGASSAAGIGRARAGGSLFSLGKSEAPAPVDPVAAAETLEAQREARRAAHKLAQREMQREGDDAAQAATQRARAAEAREALRRAEEEEEQKQSALRRQERAQAQQAQTQAMRAVEAQKERRRVLREEVAARAAQEALRVAAEEEAAAAAEAEVEAQAQAEAEQRQADEDERAAAAAAERARAKASRLAARLAALRVERPAAGDKNSSSNGGNVSERRHARRQSLQLVQASAPKTSQHNFDDDDSSKQAPQKTADAEEHSSASPTPAAPAIASRVQRRRSMYTYVPTQRAAPADGTVGDVSTRSAAGAAPASERFLRGVVVLVDVRDQDGSEASARWIEQLRSAGARVSSRAPAAGSDAAARLTHIVFKSGRPGTLHAFRALPPDARPALVGVNWIRQCLEERRRVDEAPFLVELGKQAVFQKVSPLRRRLPNAAD